MTISASEGSSSNAWEATAEANWLADLVTTGRMSVEAARELIAVPDAARTLFNELACDDMPLAMFFNDALKMRKLISEKFEALLANPVRPVPVKQAKIILRGKKREVRLPVARDVTALANTAAQETRSLASSR
ncbi:MAG TPA: hypothetical protein VJN93_13580 [Candidatus Acidoferrum sp.]|nr:hypothetical protein [Candidatus Acidoferrum sp.]